MSNWKIKIDDNKSKLAIFAVFMAILVILPTFAFSSKKNDLYVNTKASGEQDGSKNHPYKTIDQALSKASKNTQIHVSKGEYKENLTIKKGVKLLGENKDNTIIKAKKDKWATVFFKDNAEGDMEINGFTIKSGKQGVLVGKNVKASIINCIVKSNRGEGIYIEGNNTKKSNQVVISKTKVKDNGHSGIYSVGARRIVITNSEIIENKNDGIDLVRGTSAWIEGNSINSNKGSGLKLVVDGSDIWTKSNSIRKNKREGAEVSFYGGNGKINFSKSKIVENGRYGIARLQRTASANYTNWNKNLTWDEKVQFWGNTSGNTSKYLFVK